MTPRQQLKAQFFVSPDGVAVPKSRPLHGAERRRIFDRDGKRCVQCEQSLKLFRVERQFFDDCSLAHIDHIFPRSRGGQNNAENLRLLCEYCNESKGANI